MSNKLTDKDIHFLMNTISNVLTGMVQELNDILPQDSDNPDMLIADNSTAQDLLDVKERAISIARHCRGQTKDNALRYEITKFTRDTRENLIVVTVTPSSDKKSCQSHDDRN